jgi:hypothetical protein
MAHAHSYQITLSNNKTEKEALLLLLKRHRDLLVPDAAGRKAALLALGLPARLSRAFDVIRVRGGRRAKDTVQLTKRSVVTLIDVKSTRKRLYTFPRGFFFGATKNEFDLAKRLGKQFQFCFISLHPEQPPAKRIAYLTLPELEKLIRTKRTQFQVNL